MTTLLEITRHERFAKSIRRLRFERASTNVAYFKANLSSTLESLGIVELEKEIRLREGIRYCAQLKRAEERFVSRERFPLLIEALCNLKQANALHSVGFKSDLAHFDLRCTHVPCDRSHLVSRIRPYGYARLAKLLGQSVPVETSSEDHLDVYEALVLSELPVHCLTLGDGDNRSYLPASAFTNWPKYSAAGSLRSLRLHTYFAKESGWETIEQARLSKLSHVRSFVGFMADASSLESLSLHIRRDVDDDRSYHSEAFLSLCRKLYPDGSAIEIGRAKLFPKLKAFQLVDQRRLEIKALLSFLKEHSETLLDVRLSRIQSRTHNRRDQINDCFKRIKFALSREGKRSVKLQVHDC